jgi:hypothetical protein
MLYDTIETYDGLILKLEYLLRTNQAYINELLEEVTLNTGERLSLVSGMELSNKQIVKELKEVSTKLTKILKEG